MTENPSAAERQREEAADAPQTAAYEELHDGTQGGDQAPLDALFDVSLPVTIEFGRSRMTVQEILELGVGSVIQVDRLVGEPIDIYVSDRKLAEGEVVVMGEYFGVRITRWHEAVDGHEQES